MRGEHYCIALALLVDGKSTLGILGCPNLHLKNVLEPDDSINNKVRYMTITYPS